MRSDARALIHDMYENPLAGEAIEERSLAIIDREYQGKRKEEPLWPVIRRMVHTCADFSIIDQVRCSDDALDAATAALSRGRMIYADSSMIKAGISIARLKKVNRNYCEESLHVHVADDDVAALAHEERLPRSLFALRKARPILDGGIVIFGNAPVGLLELNRLIKEEKVRPALVIAMPVGFVHVIESKEELMSLGVPFIALEGRRGGSTLAVSVIHALCVLAETNVRPQITDAVSAPAKDRAIILLGHGSRVPSAAQSMDLVASGLRKRFPEYQIEIAQMSLAAPGLESVFASVVAQGAQQVIVMPYFLHEGMHYRVDIPAIMRRCGEAHPRVRFSLGRCIGYDALLVDLIAKRVRESLPIHDIREMPLLTEEEVMKRHE